MLENIYSYLLFGSASIMFTLAIILLSFRIPQAERWARFRKSCIIFAIALILIAFTNLYLLYAWIVSDQMITPYHIYSPANLVTGALLSLFVTMLYIVLIQPDYVTWKKIGKHASIIILAGVVLVSTSTVSVQLYRYCYIIFSVLYLFLIVYYTMMFRKNLHRCKTQMENYYDDEIDSRLHHIERTYYFSWLIPIVDLINAYWYTIEVDIFFIIVYTSYYLIVICFLLNYANSATFILNAVSPTPQPATVHEPIIAEANIMKSDEENQKMDKLLQQWVEEKRFTQNDISVDEIAQQIGITRDVLTSYFTKYKKTAFRTWRLELRIQEAQRLIADDPEIPTSVLCEKVGYNDRSNFHKHFQKIAGISLSEYRETQRGNK